MIVFSALDFKTDFELRKALYEYAKNSTIFIVAQRINTILKADQIVVLDEGKVVGIGNHQDLLKSCSVYREIAESQLIKGGVRKCLEEDGMGAGRKLKILKVL